VVIAATVDEQVFIVDYSDYKRILLFSTKNFEQKMYMFAGWDKIPN